MTFINKTLMATVISLLLLNTPSIAQDKKSGVSMSYTPWIVDCSTGGTKKMTCVMNLKITEQKSKREFMYIKITKVKEVPIMELRLPHRFLYPKGVKIAVDKDKETTVGILYADQLGAYASLRMEGNWMSLLRTGKNLKFSMVDLKGKPINLTLPLKNFKDASVHMK